MQDGNILDVHDDSLKIVYNKIMQTYDVPEFVKQASYELGDFGRKNKNLFAHPDLKRLPLDTEADIWMSAAFVQKTASKYSNYDLNYINREIKRVAELMDVTLPEAKFASTEYLIPVEKFAIAVPISDITDAELKDKSASYNYNGHFVLYPLDTEENIKRCNDNFPLGLDGVFESFRPKIASEIVNALPKNVPASMDVRNYLPLSKKASISQLEMRQRYAPQLKQEYSELLPLLNNDTVHDYACQLALLDKQANLTHLYNSSFYEPLKYLQGIKDDTVEEENKILKIANRELPYEFIRAKSAAIESVFPEAKELMNDFPKLQELIDKQPAMVQNFVVRKLYE